MRVRLLLSTKARLFSEETSEDRQGTEMAFSAFPSLKIMVHVVVVFQSASKLKDDQVNPYTFVPTDFQLYRKMKLKFYFRFSVFVFLAVKKRN